MANAEVKVTLKDMFNEVIALAEANDRQDIVEFAQGRIAQLEKKSATKSTNSKTRDENLKLGDEVLAILANAPKPMTASAFIGKVDGIGSSSKAVAVLKLLVENGSVVKTQDKKSNVYSLA